MSLKNFYLQIDHRHFDFYYNLLVGKGLVEKDSNRYKCCKHFIELWAAIDHKKDFTIAILCEKGYIDIYYEFKPEKIPKKSLKDILEYKK